MSGQLTRPLLEALHPAVLGELALAMRSKAAKYEPEQSQFPHRLRFPGGGEEFTGQASDALQQRAMLTGRTYGDAAHILGTTAGQLDQAQGYIAEGKGTALQFLRGVEDKDVSLGTSDGKFWNCGKPFQVGEDFTVHVRPGSIPAGAPWQIGELVQMMAAEFTEDLKRLVRQLEDLGTTWAGKVKDALDLSKLALSPKGQPYTPYDPKKNVHEQAKAIADGTMDVPSDPRQLKELWDQLSPAEKDEIYERHHDIGNHGGIPFDPDDHHGRDHYNRENLKDITTEKQNELDKALREEPTFTRETQAQWHQWKARVDQLRNELDGYKNVQATLDRSIDPKTGQQDPGKPPRFLGYVDKDNHAAVSIYNPDKAKDTGTVVPGTFSDLTKMGDYDKRSQDMMRAAAIASNGQLKDGQLSVTSWLGYDRPGTITGVEGSGPWAGDPDPALNGAKPLTDWQDGIRASHDDAAAGGPSHNTVIGHSYGTTEVGAAATHGNHLDADSVVLLASPGAFADNASGLSLAPNADVFVGKSDLDPIGVANFWADIGLGSLGPDPADWHDAYQMDAGSGGHSSYWASDNPAMKNLGQILIGHDGSNGVTPYQK